jgi:predicted PurR-regulated permease PerM
MAPHSGGLKRYAVLLLPLLVWAAVLAVISEPGQTFLSRTGLLIAVPYVAGMVLMWSILAAPFVLGSYLAVDYIRDRRRTR